MTNNISTERKSLTTLLYADKVAMVYRLAPLSLISAPFIGLLAWWAVWRISPGPLVNIWYAVLLGVCFGRAMLNKAYLRAKAGADDTVRWGRRFIIGAFAAGGMWGVAAGLLFNTGDPLAHIVLAFLVPGIAASAIAMLGPWKLAYNVFVLPLVTPLAVHLILTGNVAFSGIGFASAIFMVVLMAAAARYSKTVAESLRLRFENLALLDSLSQSKERLERSNTRLQREANERAQAENAAKEKARRLAMYIEHMPLAVIETDLNHRVVAWNPAAEQMFGYKQADIFGKSLLETIVPRDAQDAAHQFIAELMSEKRTGSSLLQVITRSGRMIMGEWHLSVIDDNAGKAIGLAIVVQDVTERKQLDRMKNEFITTVSRELHVPLAAMRSAMGTLMGSGESRFESSTINLLRTVQGHCERLTSLTEAMLDAERMEQAPGGLALQSVSLAEVARRAVADCRTLAERREVEVNFFEPAVDVKVQADGDRLLRAFTSLIHNAIKFSPEGGQVQVSFNADETRAYLSIADHGTIAPNDLQMRVMQKFSSREPQALQEESDISLGLFVSKRLIEKHGGKFSLESYHNAGNVFRIELPRLPSLTVQESFS